MQKGLASLKIREVEIQNEKNQIGLDRERAQVDKERLENRRIRLSLMEAKMALADRMLLSLDPHQNLRGQRRQVVLERLLQGIDQMSESTIEFKADHPTSELLRPRN